MAKGKGGSGKTYTSKNERISSISTRVNDPAQHLINQKAAWAKGKRVVLTIPNPNKNETNKRFIKVTGLVHWGNPKERNTPKMAVDNAD